jgi:hypothetical protein
MALYELNLEGQLCSVGFWCNRPRFLRDVSGQVISTGKLRPQVISAIEPRRASGVGLLSRFY